jgi:transcriptional regulator with XRE-family HTH domain
MAYRISGKTLESVGKNLRNIRNKQKRDQIEVAEEAGINPSYYARVERGEANPTLEVLYAIIKALRAKSSDILPF